MARVDFRKAQTRETRNQNVLVADHLAAMQGGAELRGGRGGMKPLRKIEMSWVRGILNAI